MNKHIDIDTDSFEPFGVVANRALDEIRQRRDDWLAHAKGNRRRAHDYRRWALEAERDGLLGSYRHYRAQSDRSWKAAKDALREAKIFRDINRAGEK